MIEENISQIKKGPSLFGIIFETFLFLLFLGLIAVGAYFLYQNIPGKPEILNVFVPPVELKTGNLSYAVKQFYPNMKFNHNELTYVIDTNCLPKQKERVLAAFLELQNRVDAISFKETSANPDIEVSCSEYTKNFEDKEYFVAGEGGAKEIIKTERYNVITEGIILLHDNPHGFYECEWPNIELHELLHVFGFDHSQDENSLMYPYLESCDQKLDESIVNDLNQLYSRENLPDLYFEEAIAIKKGRYLDFNVSVKNSGVISAEIAVLGVFDGGEKLDGFDLKDISFGAGVNFYVSNLKLKSRSSSNIEIRIDPDNLIKEIDEENNIAKVEF